MSVQQGVDRPRRSEIDILCLAHILLSEDCPMPQSPPLLVLCGLIVYACFACSIFFEVIKSLLDLFLAKRITSHIVGHLVSLLLLFGFLFVHSHSPFIHTASLYQTDL